MKSRKIICNNKKFITSNVLTTASPPGERQHPEQTPVLRRSRSFKVTDFCINRKLIYDFLLVINNTNLISCTVSEIQHSKCQKSLYLATLLAFKPPAQWIPWDDLRRNFPWMLTDAKVPNGEEKLPKIFTG